MSHSNINRLQVVDETKTLLDLRTLGQLRTILGDDLDALLGDFTRDTPGQIERLKQLLQENDHDALRRQAHSLKGSSGNLGMAVFSGACAQLEQYMRRESIDSDEVLGLIQAIQDAFTGTVKSLQEVPR